MEFITLDSWRRIGEIMNLCKLSDFSKRTERIIDYESHCRAVK